MNDKGSWGMFFTGVFVGLGIFLFMLLPLKWGYDMGIEEGKKQATEQIIKEEEIKENK